mmetsp:Transcript_45596/g.74316  ORF Transcript_45596/g.74316 Transcript_45596/m.74316 type:complete len:303 (+) Transcript_45596:120-1028(+)|eukprot:CAMPEP_0184665982 /NCGR_PEP_ID=MMETSP0308-20130426/59516_1 /TAXON_ID=38269 /ORGANISM="Gloeochaete witrockiana, Strain SAG 46.84" /LENGTH=302 /DNA_ID=CAMNT_0027110313 /DNA_START=113 /DNA_END=1021 /DNA_ORIENTATION=+
MSQEVLQSWEERMKQATFQRDWRQQRDFLAYLRDAKHRRADLVVACAQPLLQNHKKRLGNEVWAIYEQLLIAYLDLGELVEAKRYYKILAERFPSSCRVRRLAGLVKESEGKYDDALEVYSRILQDDQTFQPALRRKVAILKARGKIPLAIEALNAYLGVFMADFEAWGELADLYLSTQQYSSAAFCLEELILSSPQNVMHYTKYGEVLFMMGGLENLKLSRKYYVHALKNMPFCQNLRALYGLVMSCQAIATTVRSKGTESKQELKENMDIFEHAKGLLIQEYQKSLPSRLPILKAILRLE